MIAITVLGDLRGRPGAPRRARRPGDVVAIAGRQGWAAAGLAVLGRGFRSPRALVEAYQRPEPPYAAGLAAAAGRRDGDDRRLRRAARRRRATSPSPPGWPSTSAPGPSSWPTRCTRSAAALGVDPMQFILGGGDDHALVATFPAGTDLPEGFTAIGSVAEPGTAAGGHASTARRTTGRRGRHPLPDPDAMGSARRSGPPGIRMRR